jgi:hypothetical protein
MAASFETISGWVKRAKESDCTHLIVVCDTFDHDDYPVYVTKDEDIHERIKHFQQASMQRIMEVYNMSMDLDKQLKERRAYHV